MANKLLNRSKNDPKIRANRMDRKASQAAFRALPSAFAGLFSRVLTAPFGIAPNYKGTRMMDRFDRINANRRGAGQIRGAFGMMDTENAVQKQADTYKPRKTPRAESRVKSDVQSVEPSKKMKSLDGGAGAKLGAAKTEAAIVNRNIGAAQVAGGAMSMFAGGANVAAGNFGLGLVGIGFGSSLYSSGMDRIDKGLGQKETGKMISRQGDNVARSPRMAETLSMASMETGVRGPQSAPRSDHGKAYLNSAAKAKAAKPGPPQMAPARASGPAGQSGARGPTSYTTLDGRTVQGTAGQIAAWKSRRK